MKKIIIILNESHIANQVIKRAISIAKATNSLIEAIYINDMDGLNYAYPFPNDLYLLTSPIYNESRMQESNKLLQDLAKEFSTECKAEGIAYKIDIEKYVSVAHVISLSNYADLIIADSKSNSDEYSIRDILIDANCPLLLVSRNAEQIENIVFTYDGTSSSFYAIKMFSYVFPEYKDFFIKLVHMAPTAGESIPDLIEIKSWAERHFINLKFESIKGDPRKDMVALLSENASRTLVVLGAYGRSALSRLFLKSTAESIINDTDCSLFITHR